MLVLARWATDCLKRGEAALAASSRPLVLYEKQNSALRLVALDREASQLGLMAGQSLADARTLVPNLDAREIDRAYLARVFADFADWHSYASPMVSVLGEGDAFGDLVLDITGVSHLFEGEENMLATVTGRLAGLGFSVGGAIAPSVGAGWALARFAPGTVTGPDNLDAALAGLPVGALRLTEAQAAGLMAMGLKRIGQLYERPRKPLQARFGGSLLTRLDQARGHLEERVTPRLPVAEKFAERRFADPVGLLDDVLMTGRDLAVRLAADLEAEGLGAQGFHLFLYRVDHKVMVLSVNASRATRDPGHIARLFENRAERLTGEFEAGFGIDMIRLAASSLSPLAALQTGVFETRNGTEDLDRLYDRMASRLGPLAVVRSKFVNTHIPERAVKLEPVIAKTPDDPHTLPDRRVLRPLRLLPHPEAIGVTAEVPDGPPGGMVWRRVKYKFLKASGPERIAPEWWREGPEAPIRDYYVAEDDGGRRFWVFREGVYGVTEPPRWFVHGFFS